MLVWENAPEIASWMESRGAGHVSPGSFTAIGWTERGELTGGLTFRDCNGKHCLVSIALDGRKFPLPLLDAALYYVFIQLGLKRVTLVIESDNLRSQNLVTRLGAKREATLRDAGLSGDLFIYSLFPGDCYIWSRLNEKRKRAGRTKS